MIIAHGRLAEPCGTTLALNDLPRPRRPASSFFDQMGTPITISINGTWADSREKFAHGHAKPNNRRDVSRRRQRRRTIFYMARRQERSCRLASDWQAGPQGGVLATHRNCLDRHEAAELASAH